VLYILMFWSGTAAILPILGDPPPDTAAARAGIQNGDKVVRVGEAPVATWEEVHWQILQQASDASEVSLDIEDPHGASRHLRLDTTAFAAVMKESAEQDPFMGLGLRLYRYPLPTLVEEVAPDMPAEEAGIRKGDLIIAVGQRPVKYLHQVQDAVLATPEGESLRVTLRRDETEIQTVLMPKAVWEDGHKRMRIGLQWAGWSALSEAERENQLELRATVRYGLIEATGRAFGKIWETSAFSLKMFGKILVGEVSWRNLSGPVAIAEYAGRTARMGLDAYLKFMALVSISLGILNLLPIPVLDGGHLLYYALETIKGRPLSERMMTWGQNIGLTLLATLMAFALFNDLSRLMRPFFNG